MLNAIHFKTLNATNNKLNCKLFGVQRIRNPTSTSLKCGVQSDACCATHVLIMKVPQAMHIKKFTKAH